MARRMHDQIVHQPCGVPKDIGFDPDNDGWFEVQDDTVCGACAELERWHKEHEKVPAEPGTQLTVIFTRPKE